MSTFFAPGRRNPGPYTECYACGAWRKDHLGPALECPPAAQRTSPSDAGTTE